MEVIVRPPSTILTGPVEVIACVNVRTHGRICCGKRGSPKVVAALEKGLRERKIDATLGRTHCLGPCNSGPNIRIAPSNSWIFGARVKDVPDILDLVERLVREQDEANHRAAQPETESPSEPTDAVTR